MSLKSFKTALIVLLLAGAIKALKTPVRTYPLGEFSKRIIHEVDSVNYGAIERKELLNDVDKEETIYIICGELSNGIRNFAIDAAEKGYNIEIISGPEPDATEEERNKLKSYDNIRYLKAKNRPKAHGVLAGHNIYLEDPHEHGERYETAIVVRNARDDVINSFKTHFEALKATAEPG